MQYDMERDRGSTGEPSLAEMTRKAINILQKGNNGYFLLVEGLSPFNVLKTTLDSVTAKHEQIPEQLNASSIFRFQYCTAISLTPFPILCLFVFLSVFISLYYPFSQRKDSYLVAQRSRSHLYCHMFCYRNNCCASIILVHVYVVGSRIDHGHHDGLAAKALYDTLAFEDAVKVAMEMTDEDNTLIIVTADHSHVFDIAGYSRRGTDIFGMRRSLTYGSTEVTWRHFFLI